METKNCLKEVAKEVFRGCAAVPLLYCIAVVATVEKVGGWVFGILEKRAHKGNHDSSYQKKH